LAPVKFAPVSVVSIKNAFVKFAFVKLQFVKLDPVKSIPDKFTPVKLTPEKSVYVISPKCDNPFRAELLYVVSEYPPLIKNPIFGIVTAALLHRAEL
jgi:hypothetical protein